MIDDRPAPTVRHRYLNALPAFVVAALGALRREWLLTAMSGLFGVVMVVHAVRASRRDTWPPPLDEQLRNLRITIAVLSLGGLAALGGGIARIVAGDGRGGWLVVLAASLLVMDGVLVLGLVRGRRGDLAGTGPDSPTRARTRGR